MAKLLLVDLDPVCYRAAFAAEKTKYLVSDDYNKTPILFYHDDAKAAKADAEYRNGIIWSRKEVQPVEQAILIARTMLADIKARYPEHTPRLHLSGVGNFRHGIATRANYKSGRAASPTHLKAVREMFKEMGAVINNGQEADDGLAIDATANPGSVIASIDGDLLQVPGLYYNFSTKEETLVSKKDGMLNFYEQVLTGDATDSVPGVPGIGPVKARKLLAEATSPLHCWDIVQEAYDKAFGPKGFEYVRECAQLVWVLRKPNEPWKPPVAA